MQLRPRVRRFYYSRGAVCCAELRSILGCESGPGESCRGFTGNCADLQSQFSELQGPFLYGSPLTMHDGLDEFECHAFPDDAYPTDQLLVGLISVAVAFPVDILLARAFEVANEGDEPAAWLEMPRGWVRKAMSLLFGHDPQRRWHYLPNMQEGVKHCDSDAVKWYLRFSGESYLSTAVRLLVWVKNKVVSETHAADIDDCDDDAAAGSSTSSSAHADARIKRLIAALGFLTVYVVWAIFTWCVPCSGIARTRLLAHLCLSIWLLAGLFSHVRASLWLRVALSLTSFFTVAADGALIYTNLGADAQQKFAQTWGVGTASRLSARRPRQHQTDCIPAALQCRLWTEQHHRVEGCCDSRGAGHLCDGLTRRAWHHAPPRLAGGES